MIRPPPGPTRTDTLVAYTTLFRSPPAVLRIVERPALRDQRSAQVGAGMASRREAAAGYVPSVAVDVADLAVDSPCASELPHRLRRHLPTEVDDAIPALAGLARLRSVDTPQPHALAGDYQCVAVEHLFHVAREPARRLGASGVRNSGDRQSVV